MFNLFQNFNFFLKDGFYKNNFVCIKYDFWQGGEGRVIKFQIFSDKGGGGVGKANFFFFADKGGSGPPHFWLT